MKSKILFLLVITNFVSATFAQSTKGTLYKSDHWADIKKYGSWAKASDNPIHEKVEILLTEKNFKVTFGIKVYNYAIISSKPFSQYKMDYKVTLNEKKYVIAVALMPDGTTTIGIEGVWLVEDVQDIIFDKK